MSIINSCVVAHQFAISDKGMLLLKLHTDPMTSAAVWYSEYLLLLQLPWSRIVCTGLAAALTLPAARLPSLCPIAPASLSTHPARCQCCSVSQQAPHTPGTRSMPTARLRYCRARAHMHARTTHARTQTHTHTLRVSIHVYSYIVH